MTAVTAGIGWPAERELSWQCARVWVCFYCVLNRWKGTYRIPRYTKVFPQQFGVFDFMFFFLKSNQWDPLIYEKHISSNQICFFFGALCYLFNYRCYIYIYTHVYCICPYNSISYVICIWICIFILYIHIYIYIYIHTVLKIHVYIDTHR